MNFSVDTLDCKQFSVPDLSKNYPYCKIITVQFAEIKSSLINSTYKIS